MTLLYHVVFTHLPDLRQTPALLGLARKRHLGDSMAWMKHCKYRKVFLKVLSFYYIFCFIFFLSYNLRLFCSKVHRFYSLNEVLHYWKSRILISEHKKEVQKVTAPLKYLLLPVGGIISPAPRKNYIRIAQKFSAHKRKIVCAENSLPVLNKFRQRGCHAFIKGYLRNQP